MSRLFFPMMVVLLGGLATGAYADSKDEDAQEAKESLGMHIGASESSTWSVHADRWGKSGSGNETPSDVIGDMEELKEQRIMATEFEPAHVAAIDREMACAKVRLEIARKRAARDAYRKQGHKTEAEQVDKQIHALKAKLVGMEHSIALAGTISPNAARE
jgi:hypothetical protein